MYRLLLTVVIFCIAFRSFCQETKLSSLITTIAEELASDDADPLAVTVYIERLQELAENPVRINSSSPDEISRLFFLSDFQMKALADYCNISGRINTIFEIASIPGFNKETAEMMAPFISLETNPEITYDTLRWKSSILSNLFLKLQNIDTSFSGSPLKTLIRYRFNAGPLSGNITAEKDEGEKFLTGNPPVPDFLSASLSYNGSGIIKRIIAGDYSIRYGQGTNINTGIRTGLSLTAPGVMASRDEIKQYTSFDENNFLRGVASQFSFKNLGISFFYSNKLSDATLNENSFPSMRSIDNFYTGGLHNTPSLELKKDVVSVTTYGMNISYNFNSVRIGMANSNDKISIPVKPSGSGPENIFDFSGDRKSLYSVYYSALIKKILLFGELSSDGSDQFAGVQGLSMRPSDRLTVNFLFRKYSTGYFTLHGRGPGSSSSTDNEEGILGNFTFEAAKHLFISGGCDVHRFPWLRYRNSGPSSGIKREIRVTFLPFSQLTFEALYVYRLVMYDDAESTGIAKQEEIITRSFKSVVKYSPNGNLTFGTRLDFRKVTGSGSTGILLLQDINYRISHPRISFWYRYCIFSTGDWDSRLYTYENDLLYNFSIPALYGKGSRSYIMIKYDIRDNTEIRIKYGTTLQRENNTTHEKSEIKLQIRLLF